MDSLDVLVNEAKECRVRRLGEIAKKVRMLRRQERTVPIGTGGRSVRVCRVESRVD